MEDRIPRLIFSTHVFSGLDVHNSSIRPSWKENANGDSSKLVLNSPFVSASILFFGESGSDSNSLTLPSYKTTNYYSYEYCTLTFYFNIF